MQQVTPTPGGPHNPNSHSEQTILRALKGLDGSRRMTFRFELLDSQDRKLRDLDHAEIDAQGASVSLNNLADAAKRTARFRILDGGPDPIDWLSNRIKPWARLHLPPYGEHDFVEWPLGVFIPVAPSRTTDATGTVWRDVEAYDKLMILDEDLIPGRFSTDGILDVYDGFFRDVTGGWGITDSGQPWASTSTPDTTSAVTSAGGGYALIRLDASNNLIRIKVPYQRYRDGEVYTTVSVDQMATGQAMLPAVLLRLSADLSFYYRLRVHLEIDGSVSLSITRGTTQIGSTVATSVTYTPGAWLHVRARLVGQIIQGKVWADGTSEPSEWLIEQEITTDPLFEGYFGLAVSTFALNTNTAPEFRFGEFALNANPQGLVTGVIRQVLEQAGITRHRITPSPEVLPSVREWEPGTSRLAIVNELLGAISYRSLSFDEHGVAVCEPYVPPSERAVEYTYADDHESVMLVDADQNLDLHAIPNRWVLSVSEADQQPITVTYTNADPASPTSTVRRGRVITDFRQEQDATSESALIEQAARIAYESSQVYEELVFSTAVMPIHSHDDVYRIRRDDLALDAKYTSHTWEMPLEAGGIMRHTARRVVPLTAGSDPSIVVGDKTITGALVAGNIASGTVLISPVANAPTMVSITGLNLQGTGPVTVQAAPVSTVPGSQVREVGIRDPSPTGFNLFLYRTNSTNTNVHWIAMRRA